VRNQSSQRVDKLGLTIVATEHGALASLEGRIDIDSSPAVREQLISLLYARRAGTVSIDL